MIHWALPAPTPCHDAVQVPTTLQREFFSTGAALTDVELRRGAGACSSPAPETDLSVFPMVPPVEPACAKAPEAPTAHGATPTTAAMTIHIFMANSSISHSTPINKITKTQLAEWASPFKSFQNGPIASDLFKIVHSFIAPRLVLSAQKCLSRHTWEIGRNRQIRLCSTHSGARGRHENTVVGARHCGNNLLLRAGQSAGDGASGQHGWYRRQAG